MDDSRNIGKDSRHTTLPGTQKEGKAAAGVCGLHEERRGQTREDKRWREAAIERVV